MIVNYVNQAGHPAIRLATPAERLAAFVDHYRMQCEFLLMVLHPYQRPDWLPATNPENPQPGSVMKVFDDAAGTHRWFRVNYVRDNGALETTEITEAEARDAVAKGATRRRLQHLDAILPRKTEPGDPVCATCKRPIDKLGNDWRAQPCGHYNGPERLIIPG